MRTMPLLAVASLLAVLNTPAVYADVPAAVSNAVTLAMHKSAPRAESACHNGHYDTTTTYGDGVQGWERLAVGLALSSALLAADSDKTDRYGRPDSALAISPACDIGANEAFRYVEFAVSPNGLLMAPVSQSSDATVQMLKRSRTDLAIVKYLRQ